METGAKVKLRGSPDRRGRIHRGRLLPILGYPTCELKTQDFALIEFQYSTANVGGGDKVQAPRLGTKYVDLIVVTSGAASALAAGAVCTPATCP